MRLVPRLLSSCLALSALAASAAEFTGRLEPAVRPGTRSLSPVVAAPAAVIAALPQPPAADARVWSLPRPFSIKGREYLVAVLAEASGRKTLWLDRDGDGRFSPAEAWPFPAEGKSVQLTLPWANGIYREFPLTVEYGDRPARGPAPAEAPAPTTVATLTYNFNLVFAGSVDVDGRPMRLEFYPLPAVSGIDPATSRTFLDANQNGELDRDAGEMDTGRGKAPVFRAGRRFLAVKSVDLATGAIVVEERPASDYTRFDAQPGQQMPDFTFTDFAGKARRLSDLRGQLVLLDFWGTWCLPCIEEMKHLDPVYAKYRARGFEIISLNMERTSGKLTAEEYRAVNEKARAFIAKAGHAWLQATQESIERVALDVIHVNAYPTCILLDREGKVLSRDARGDTLVRLLEQHLPSP